MKSKGKHCVVCCIAIVLLAALVIGGGYFLFKDYRDYRKNYRDFLYYREYGPLLRQSIDEREYIVALAEKREEVYGWEDSYEKTVKINEIDRMILEAADYDFSDLSIEFVGDSITFGTGGSEREDGSKVSYVEYVDEILKFGNVIKESVPGRQIADEGWPERSLQRNLNDMMSGQGDIIVFFCGLNDYLAPAPTEEGKFWGCIEDADREGYCGQLRELMQELDENYSGKDILFVTCYLVANTVDVKYADHEGDLMLADYMEQQSILAERYGYPVIDLCNTGFMNFCDEKTAKEFSWDGLHPNENGYRILGEHIAAELILHYLGF